MYFVHVNWIYLPLPSSLSPIPCHDFFPTSWTHKKSIQFTYYAAQGLYPCLSLHQQPPVADSSSASAELHESFYPCWDFVRILCRSWTRSHSFYEFMYTVALTSKQMLFCCRHLLPVALTVFLFCLQWFLSLGGRDVILLSHLELSISSLLFSERWPVISLCINYPILCNETSPMRV